MSTPTHVRVNSVYCGLPVSSVHKVQDISRNVLGPDDYQIDGRWYSGYHVSPTAAPTEAPKAPEPTSAERLLDRVRDMASEDGENPEYDRALVEFVAEEFGITSLYADAPEAVTKMVLGR